MSERGREERFDLFAKGLISGTGLFRVGLSLLRVLAVSVRDLSWGDLIPSGCRREMRQEDGRWNRRSCPVRSLFPPS